MYKCNDCCKTFEKPNSVLNARGTRDDECPYCESWKFKELPKLKISETLIIGFDASYNDDAPVLMVSNIKGTTHTCINMFIGKEAEELYTKLTQKIKGAVINVRS